MNLLEAIKSGKPFDGEHQDEKGLMLWEDSDGSAWLARFPSWEPKRHVRCSDFSKDWQPQEPTVTMTRSQFLKAVFELWREKYGGSADTGFADEVARKLGLEP